MTIKERYKDRYRSGNTPWDIGQPDFNLIEVRSAAEIILAVEPYFEILSLVSSHFGSNRPFSFTVSIYQNRLRFEQCLEQTHAGALFLDGQKRHLCGFDQMFGHAAQ